MASKFEDLAPDDRKRGRAKTEVGLETEALLGQEPTDAEEAINRVMPWAEEADQKFNQIQECPVFRPSLQDFQQKSFSEILTDCESKVGSIGIFKVIAPEGWTPRKSGYENVNFNVRKPIEQNVNGSKGIYELVNFVKDSKSLSRFMCGASEFDSYTSDKSDAAIERLFWRTLKNSAPVYGADTLGTMFDAGVPWNLGEIKTLLNDGLKSSEHIEGVTSPYIYVGTWKAMFGWHKEDLDLYSINYLHAGQPKFWYGIDLNQNTKFENYVKSNFRDQFRQCPEYIRHKTTLIHPENLLEQGIKIKRAVQRPREFVISRASAYHSGFNAGYNIAEAVNFALKPWLKIADKVGSCKCVRDSVQINMKQFRKRLNGEESTYSDDFEPDFESDTMTKQLQYLFEKQPKQPKKLANSSASVSVASMSARKLQQQIDELCKRSPSFGPDRKVLSTPVAKTKATGSRQASSLVKATVKCTQCRRQRHVNQSQMERYRKESWKESFLCYKFRLKNVTCFEPDGRKEIVALKKEQRAVKRREHKQRAKEEVMAQQRKRDQKSKAKQLSKKQKK